MDKHAANIKSSFAKGITKRRLLSTNYILRVNTNQVITVDYTDHQNH